MPIFNFPAQSTRTSDSMVRVGVCISIEKRYWNDEIDLGSKVVVRRSRPLRSFCFIRFGDCAECLFSGRETRSASLSPLGDKYVEPWKKVLDGVDAANGERDRSRNGTGR